MDVFGSDDGSELPSTPSAQSRSAPRVRAGGANLVRQFTDLSAAIIDDLCGVTDANNPATSLASSPSAKGGTFQGAAPAPAVATTAEAAPVEASAGTGTGTGTGTHLLCGWLHVHTVRRQHANGGENLLHASIQRFARRAAATTVATRCRCRCRSTKEGAVSILGSLQQQTCVP